MFAGIFSRWRCWRNGEDAYPRSVRRLASGKINRRALPNPETLVKKQAQYVAPTTKTWVHFLPHPLALTCYILSLPPKLPPSSLVHTRTESAAERCVIEHPV